MVVGASVSRMGARVPFRSAGTNLFQCGRSILGVAASTVGSWDSPAVGRSTAPRVCDTVDPGGAGVPSSPAPAPAANALVAAALRFAAAFPLACFFGVEQSERDFMAVLVVGFDRVFSRAHEDSLISEFGCGAFHSHLDCWRAVRSQLHWVRSSSSGLTACRLFVSGSVTRPLPARRLWWSTAPQRVRAPRAATIPLRRAAAQRNGRLPNKAGLRDLAGFRRSFECARRYP